MEAVLTYHGVLSEYTKLLEKLDGSVLNIQEDVLDGVSDTIQRLVTMGSPTKANLSTLIEKLEQHCGQDMSVEDVPFIVRSSANVEDLAGLSAAGLYESILNVNPFRDIEGFAQSIAAVWASLHSRRAILSRKYAQVTQSLARMAVLVQNLTAPYMSLIINTKSPIPAQRLKVLLDGARPFVRRAAPEQEEKGAMDPVAGHLDEHWLYFEAALGLGEVLASAGIVRGSPYQVLANMRTKEYLVMEYASFAVSYHSTLKPPEQDEDQITAARFVDEKITDYTQDIFCFNDSMKDSVVAKVLSAASFLQLHFHTPQDIEGAIVLRPMIKEAVEREVKGADDVISRVAALQRLKITEGDFDLVVVQTRPQPL